MWSAVSCSCIHPPWIEGVGIAKGCLIVLEQCWSILVLVCSSCYLVSDDWDFVLFFVLPLKKHQMVNMSCWLCHSNIWFKILAEWAYFKYLDHFILQSWFQLISLGFGNMRMRECLHCILQWNQHSVGIHGVLNWDQNARVVGLQECFVCSVNG